AVKARIGRIELLRELDDLAIDPLEGNAIGVPGFGGVGRIRGMAQRLDLLGDMPQLLLEPRKVLRADDFRVELALARGDLRDGIAQPRGSAAGFGSILLRPAEGSVECCAMRWGVAGRTKLVRAESALPGANPGIRRRVEDCGIEPFRQR